MMNIENADQIKEQMTLDEVIGELEKELAYRRYLYPGKVKADPRKRQVLELRYLRLEKGVEVLREVRKEKE